MWGEMPASTLVALNYFKFNDGSMKFIVLFLPVFSFLRVCRHTGPAIKRLSELTYDRRSVSRRSCAHTIQPCAGPVHALDWCGFGSTLNVIHRHTRTHKRPHIDSLNATHFEGGNWHIKWTHCKCARHRRKIRWEAASHRAVCHRRAARINVNTEQNAITPTTATKYISRELPNHQISIVTDTNS